MARHIDFQRLLDENRVPYVTRGANVKRGELNIQCPFCGAADPSFHMGISPDTGYWACWRNEDHRGKSPLRLLVRLLGISYWQAREIAGLTPDYVDPDGFSTVVAWLRSTGFNPAAQPDRAPPELHVPESFRPIDGSYATLPYLRYVEDRGFTPKQALELCYDYGLECDPVGDWSGRVIMPFYMDRQLVAWTGRSINPRSAVRYKDLDVKLCVVPPKHTVYNHDVMLRGGKWLIVVEGPWDALKLDYFGAPHGVRAVALSTNSAKEEQLYLLGDAAKGFQGLGIMMDNADVLGAVDSMRMASQFAQAHHNVRTFPVPGRAKDAGAATGRDIVRFCEEIT